MSLISRGPRTRRSNNNYSDRKETIMTHLNFDKMSFGQLRSLIETLTAKAIKWGRSNQSMPYRFFLMKLVVWIGIWIEKIEFPKLLIDERNFIRFLTSYIKEKPWIEKEDVWDNMGKTKSSENIEKVFEKKFGWSLEHCVFCRQRMHDNNIKHEQDCPIPKLESVVAAIEQKELKAAEAPKSKCNSSPKSTSKVVIEPIFSMFEESDNGNHGSLDNEKRNRLVQRLM